MSAVTIRLTSPLRKFTAGLHEVQLPAHSVGEALQALHTRYPALQGRVLDEHGQLREFIQVHVGKAPLRQLGGLQAALSPGDVLSLSSPFSGG
jgi:molybdopterin converting factor small subunit